MRHEDIWELYKDGGLEALLVGFEDVESLDMFHSAMFENASDVGVTKGSISARMDDVNFEMARKHMLDERDVEFLTRTSMEQFDRPVACDIIRSQIMAIGALIAQHVEEHGDTDS